MYFQVNSLRKRRYILLEGIIGFFLYFLPYSILLLVDYISDDGCLHNNHFHFRTT